MWHRALADNGKRVLLTPKAPLGANGGTASKTEGLGYFGLGK